MKDSTIELAVSTTFLTVGIAVGLVLSAGCSVGGTEPMLGDAEAQIGRTMPDPPVLGEGDFEEQEDGTVLVEIAVEGAPPGPHAVHVHEIGDCGSGGMDAGGHWNPEDTSKGAPADGSLGDIGNLVVRDDGVGTLEFATPYWTVGDGSSIDVMGKAVIIHAGPDDPSGATNPRIACGIIEADID
jgi:superoxide dismutase, Cu-Zn family